MNFQNLEYFIAVAKEGNITHAAEQLGISQQALSNQIARMEAELGTELFDRRHGFSLTYSGKYFLESAGRILDINKQTETVLNDIIHSKRGALKIGISFTRGQAILPLVLPDFSLQYPGVTLSLEEASTHTLEEMLSRGDIDLMIGYTPFMSESAVAINLMKEHLYFVVPKNLMEGIDENDFNRRPDITRLGELPFVLLKKGDRIRDLVDAEFRFHKMTPDIKIETDNIQTSFALACEGMGIAVIPELYINSPFLISGEKDFPLKSNAALLRFSDNDARNTINLAIGYNEDRYLGHIAGDFIKLCEKKFRMLS